MIVIGVDAHKRVHVAIALDGVGQEIGEWSGPNSATGWRDLGRWAASLPTPRVWGIEGAWSYGRGLSQCLVAQGETVYEINARWTALNRRGARRPGETDRLDARAVARFVRQEVPSLPEVAPEDQTAVLDLLTTEREAALAAYAGVAPLEASSAGHVRHRLNRGGNRRLNVVLYRIALTQAHHLPAARAYLDRRVAEGKTRREARRALTRYIVRAIWRLWQECSPAVASVPLEEAA